MIHRLRGSDDIRRALETFLFEQNAFLDHVSRRIMNEISGISRVTYDISGKPPGTIEWE